MIDKVRSFGRRRRSPCSSSDMDIVFKIAPEIVVFLRPHSRDRHAGRDPPDEAVIEADLGTEHHAGAR